MSTFVLLTITGLGLGAMYFLVASGLSLIYGLMGVLNFAHGAFITVGAYAAWWLAGQLGGSAGVQLLVGGAFGLAAGAVLAGLIELVFIRPLYRRPIEQVLVTVGLALALGALVQGIWGTDARPFPMPSWMVDTTSVLGASIPNNRFVVIAVAAAVLVGLTAFLRYTRFGLIIRAGVENRAMVTALGIDVRRAFTIVFALGGALAALAGVLSGVYFGSIDPARGTSLLIFAFIVVVIGGFGSIGGSAIAAVTVGLVQQYANYYASPGTGDLAVVLLLAAVLLIRPAGLAPEGGTLTRPGRKVIVPLCVLVVLGLVPELGLDIPVVFTGPLDSPGTLQLLALCLVFAGAALSYDLLFGFTGLLSFGHALYFAFGVYMTAIALTKWEWNLWQTLGFVALGSLVLSLVLGAVSLRVTGIAFAMVTLAFAQAGTVLVQKNPYGWTGGEEGIGLNFEHIPDFFVGVLNTRNLYWLALAYAAVVFVAVRFAVGSSAGHVWQAVRENEQRVEVIGLRPLPFKLASFVLASVLATAGGIVWLLLIGGATPEVTTANFTLSLLVMVVLGGAGTRYGAMIGGFAYILLDQRLGSLGDNETVQGLPSLVRVPLSEPLFILGSLFIAVVFFIPGGLASLPNRLRGLRPAREPLPEEAGS